MLARRAANLLRPARRVPNRRHRAQFSKGDCVDAESISEAGGHLTSTGWCLYLLECKNGVYYAGITNRLAERFAAHQAGKGARFTRSHPPIRIVGSRAYADRSEASKAEYAIKRLPRSRKVAFLSAP